jgi:hypothetical protein
MKPWSVVANGSDRGTVSLFRESRGSFTESERVNEFETPAGIN